MAALTGVPARLDPLRRSPLAPPPRTLVDILEQTAAEHGGAPALDDGDTVLTYRTLLRQVRGIWPRNDATRGVAR